MRERREIILIPLFPIYKNTVFICSARTSFHLARTISRAARTILISLLLIHNQLYLYLCDPVRVILYNLMLPYHPLVLAIRLRTYFPTHAANVHPSPHRAENSYPVIETWAVDPLRVSGFVSFPARFLLRFNSRTRRKKFFRDQCLRSSYSVHR
jgi:hypothetical protein